MSNDNQADKHCIFGSLIINVESFFKKVEPQKLNFATFPGLSWYEIPITKLAFTYSKLKIETLDQGVKHFQSWH